MRRPSLWQRGWGFAGRWPSYERTLSAPREVVRRAWSEFGPSSVLFRELDEALRSAPEAHGAALGASLRGASRLERVISRSGPSLVNRELYTFVRVTRPKVALETGVASGISTAIILEAMERNGAGQLRSIDLPNFDPAGYVNADGKRESVTVPRGRDPGWAIPARLRHRWTLTLGSSQEVMERVLHELGPIDFFFHDSEHSESTMGFEYRNAWRDLVPGGLLYSDDVIWNQAFDGFAAEVGTVPALTPAGRGAIRKPVGIPATSYTAERRR